MDYINAKMGPINSFFAKTALIIVVIVSVVTSYVYPEMMIRMFMLIWVGFAFFFGFAPNAAHTAFYDAIKIGKVLRIFGMTRLPRWFTVYVLSVFCYFSALSSGYNAEL